MREVDQPKKPTSERRKQQNRQAQKNYRDRQNRKLRTLEALIESREVSLGDRVGLQGSAADSLSCIAPYTPESTSTNEEGSQVLNPLLLANSKSGPATGVSHVLKDMSAHHEGELPKLLPDEASTVGLKSLDGSEATSLLTTQAGLDSLLSEDDRLVIASKGLNIQEILKAGIQAISKRPVAQPETLLRRSDEDEDEVQDSALRTDKIYLIQNATGTPANHIPDIHANTIRVKQLCTVAAIRHNSEMLGVTFEQVIDLEMGSRFCSSMTATQDGDHFTADRFEHVTRDLRPTPAQIKYEHSAWIDTMPFPTLRQRLIECINAEPPIVDEDEFCQDLNGDGLVCWGSAGSKTDRPVGSGAPWDMRSWEAQPWFLRKWWFLIGGKDGELFQASRWWNEMRGGSLPYAWR